MGITTRHDSTTPSERWTETIEGATPNSVDVSINAKGAAQVAVKIYYASAAEMATSIAEDTFTILGEVRDALIHLDIPLAGQELRESH